MDAPVDTPVETPVETPAPAPVETPVGNHIDISTFVNVGPPPPDILTLSELLSDQSVVLAKEEADKILLETIGGQSVGNLRPKLVEWVLKGRPDAFPILGLDIQPPACCSDGTVRDLTDYIPFCSGKTIVEHVALLQAKLPDIHVSFANMGGITTIVVFKV